MIPSPRMSLELLEGNWGRQVLVVYFAIARVRFYLCFLSSGCCESNEAEVLAILEALRCFSRLFHGELIVESDYSNAIAWVSNRKANPWKFNFSLMKFVFYFLDLALSPTMNLDRPTLTQMLCPIGSWKAVSLGGQCNVMVDGTFHLYLFYLLVISSCTLFAFLI